MHTTGPLTILWPMCLVALLVRLIPDDQSLQDLVAYVDGL